jgi:hypothetical protein
MAKDRYSILVPSLDKCFVCGTSNSVHIHEVFFGTANRKKSIEDGMTVGLCMTHHNGSSQGVHFNKDLDLFLKQHAEKIWIEHYCDESLSEDEKIQEFIDRYGKNFI